MSLPRRILRVCGASSRNEANELRLFVEERNRPGEQPGSKAQGPAAQDLDGPSGVEVARIVSSVALHDAWANANVRKHAQPLHEDIDQRHEAECLGVEQAPESQIAQEAKYLAASVPD